MKTIFNRLIMPAIMFFAIISGAFALNEAEKEELGKFIRQYLIENPDILTEAQTALEARLALEKQHRIKDVITSMSHDLYNGKSDIIIGHSDADVTIIEFFDYNCGYCKQALSTMQEITEQDLNVRFILKEFPILGQHSLEAAHVSISVSRIAPEKSAQFHIALLGINGQADKDKAMQIARDLDIDMIALENQLTDTSLLEKRLDDVRTTYKLAENLGINGTPSYVIGDEAIFGAVNASQILSRITNIRKCGKTICS